MTEAQIWSVFIENGCIDVPSGWFTTEWYLNEKYCTWDDKIGEMLTMEKNMIFGNVVSFDDLTPEFIEEQINLVRKRVKIIKINERLKDLEKDFVKL